MDSSEIPIERERERVTGRERRAERLSRWFGMEST
jgi:hypothetical protein